MQDTPCLIQLQSVYFAVCCPRSTPSVAWIWWKDELPLCFLIVLRVCSTNPHIRKCCALSREVAWQIRLPGEYACWFCSSRAGGLRITAFEKVLLQSFPLIEGLSMLQLQKLKRTSTEVTFYLRSQMTKRNSSKTLLVSWLPSPEISNPQVVQNCWHWSCRRRESIATYCTCKL